MIEYITKQDIRDRAKLLGYVPTYNPMSDDYARMAEEAEAQLVEEHIQQIFEWHDEALEALPEHVENPNDVAWFLLKGMGEHDECATDGEKFWFGDWEISHESRGWLFDHMHRYTAFYDDDLMAGLQVCDEHERSPEAMRESLERDLKPLQASKLRRLMKAAREEAFNQMTGQLKAVGGAK